MEGGEKKASQLAARLGSVARPDTGVVVVAGRFSASDAFSARVLKRSRQMVGYWDILCFRGAHVDRYASPQASSWGDRTVSRPSTPALQAVSVFAR